MDKTAENLNLWRKLLEVQKKFATFNNSEPSDRTGRGGQPEYKFTPNWQIIEPIRAELDAAGIMLLTDIEDITTQVVEYPVYRMNGENIVSFLKKDTLSTVKMKYRFLDTSTGECTPEMRMVATDANGIDKSTSCAVSLAERYIFLKFFHITTRERDESSDFHDCQQNLPGIGRLNGDGRPAVTQRQAPARPAQPTSAPRTQTPAAASPAAQQQRRNTQAQPTDLFAECARSLALFQADTLSYNSQMNSCLTRLAQAGYPTADPDFQKRLRGESQRIRTAGI